MTGLIRGDGVCPPRLNCVNDDPDRRNNVTEIPSSPAGVASLGVAGPETATQRRLASAKRSAASAPKALLHGLVLCELGKRASRDNVVLDVVLNNGVEISHAPTDARLCSRLART